MPYSIRKVKLSRLPAINCCRTSRQVHRSRFCRKPSVEASLRVRPFRTVRVRDQAHRSYARRFSIGEEEYTLLVLQSLHRQREFLESVIAAFGLAIPLAILLASGGGYFLARRSLSPVVEMSTQAGRIGADNLHERLPVRNAQDELGHLAESFNNLLDRLDHRLSSSGDLWRMHLTNCELP